MIRKIGIKPKSINPEIFLSSEEKLKSTEIKKQFAPINQKLIGINTTSGKSSPNISTEEYRKLILRLTKEKNIRVVVTDNNPPDEIRNIENVLYPNIGLTLRESIINFSVLDCLISASTGPMHICAALNVPTLSMFCPLPACSPKLWGPLGNKSEIILSDENYCHTICSGDPHNCDFSGKGGIDAEKIYYRIKSFMNF
jgi:heptosyltransferase-2